MFQIQRKLAGVYSSKHTLLPPALLASFQFLNLFGLDEQGLFRLSGNHTALQHHIQQFNSGMYHDHIISTGVDVNDSEFYLTYVLLLT